MVAEVLHTFIDEGVEAIEIDAKSMAPFRFQRLLLQQFFLYRFCFRCFAKFHAIMIALSEFLPLANCSFVVIILLNWRWTKNGHAYKRMHLISMLLFDRWTMCFVWQLFSGFRKNVSLCFAHFSCLLCWNQHKTLATLGINSQFHWRKKRRNAITTWITFLFKLSLTTHNLLTPDHTQHANGKWGCASSFCNRHRFSSCNIYLSHVTFTRKHTRQILPTLKRYPQALACYKHTHMYSLLAVLVLSSLFTTFGFG